MEVTRPGRALFGAHGKKQKQEPRQLAQKNREVFASGKYGKRKFGGSSEVSGSSSLWGAGAKSTTEVGGKTESTWGFPRNAPRGGAGLVEVKDSGSGFLGAFGLRGSAPSEAKKAREVSNSPGQDESKLGVRPRLKAWAEGRPQPIVDACSFDLECIWRRLSGPDGIEELARWWADADAARHISDGCAPQPLTCAPFKVVYPPNNVPCPKFE